MNGRVEKDLRIYKQIEQELNLYPEFVSSWYYYLKANGQSATSCREYIAKLRRFLLYINNDINKIKVDNFNEDIIIKYFIDIKFKEDGSETSVSYKQGTWSCLSNFFQFIYDRNLISQNYFETSGIKRPKGNDLDRINRNRVLLTKDDFQKILSAVDKGVGSNKAKGYQKTFKNRDKAILLIFMTTGVRKTALEEINVDDIDLENHKLYVIDKFHKSHTYYLNEETVKIIDRWLMDRYFILGDKKTDALFISKERQRMSGNSITKLVDKYASAALGYHISPHKLRSGFASIMYEETKDIEFVRRVIGHSNVTTTQRYIVTNNDERKEAIDILGSLLEN